jgi:hypothetical protein
LTKQRKILIIGGLVIISQILIFRDYISPFHWGQIKVSGLACTCPDETVVNGQLYLKSITPDSLKKYDLDYSEIYVTERPSTDFDPMGVDLYIIKGQVIGKERVSECDAWNPKVKIENWREVNLPADWGVKILIVIELLVFVLLLKKEKAPNNV